MIPGKAGGRTAAIWLALLGSAQAIAIGAAAVELRGFPVRLPGKVDTSSPAVADIDGDGKPEIAICAGAQLVVLDANGAPLPGFPVALVAADDETEVRNTSSPALCDIDGDGKREIIAAGPDRRLHALSTTGAALAGWPRELTARASVGPSCADVNGDGKLDVVIATDDNRLIALHGNGAPIADFKPAASKVSAAPLAVVDLAPDRRGDELAIGGPNGRFYLVDGTGRIMPGFPVSTSYAISGGAAAGDVDGDGAWDLVFGSQDFRVYAVHADGQLLPGFPIATGYRIYGGVALGDLDGDGVADIVVGGGDGKLLALRGTGAALPGWPVDTRARIYSTPALADLDHDGKLEVLVTVSDGQLRAFKHDGKPLPGFPIEIGGDLKSSPQVVDLDGNGAFEVLVASPAGELHGFSIATATALRGAELAWPGFGHDAERVARTRPNRGTFSGIRVSPPDARAGDALTCDYQYRDLDNDPEGSTRIRWYRNGKRVDDLDDKKQLPARTASKDERWHCTVQDGDDFAERGEGPGARIAVASAVRLKNTPPGAPGIGFAGDGPRARAPLRLEIAEPSRDDDGDKVSYRVRWLRDRAPVAGLSDPFKVPATLLRKGQAWEALVVPFDGEAEGASACAAAVVGNTPPDPPKISLSPREPRSGDLVSVRIDKPALDPDGDQIRYQYEWSVDGVVRPLSRSAAQLAADVAGRGHKLAVAVVAHDGEAPGAPAQAEVVIANTPPPAPKLELVPPKPRSGDEVALKIGSTSADADGDPVSHKVVWIRDRTPVAGWTGPRVERGLLKKGERYQVKVTPSDGSSSGTAAQLEFSVGNTPPGAPKPAISPAQPRAGEPLKAQISAPAVDRDGDRLTYGWKWLRNGEPVAGLTGDTVPAGRTRKGEVWQIQAIASDGGDRGPVGSAEVRIVDTPPRAPQLALLPEKRTAADPLRVELRKPAVDPDGDAVSYRYTWLRNGATLDVPDSTTELKPGTVRGGDTVTAVVTAVTEGGASATNSIQVTVGGMPPGEPQVRIVPKAPLTEHDLLALVPELPADPDGDPVKVEVSWLRNGQPAAIRGLRVPAAETKRGEVWTAVAVAGDGALTSAPGRAEVTIGNTPPRLAKVALD
ncbi:MAG: VCBS repeat-containing protein, partial [Deltaproteobacteria bacterium]|nr:VCBS repeat-containing protein [Deltaproteobacteria bacterium]